MSPAKDSQISLSGLLDTMHPILLAAGIPVGQVRIRSGRHQVNTCATAFDWLHDIYMSPEYADVLAIWILVAPATWARYEKLGVEGLREQDELTARGKKLQKAWRSKRPRLFGKDLKPRKSNGN